ncbi:hypothetical protein BC629DRAFT_1534353 [Irpex lacteus]|nr:hypothetical protein BC629DRAFT_1534353 [Irpex lacteus]
MSDSTSNTPGTRQQVVASALGHVGTQNEHFNSSGDVTGPQDYQWFFWPRRFPGARFDAFASYLCFGLPRQPQAEDSHPRSVEDLTRDPDMAQIVSQLKHWQSQRARPSSLRAQDFVHDNLEVHIESCTSEVERVTESGTEFDFESKTKICINLMNGPTGPNDGGLVVARHGGPWKTWPMRMLVAKKSSTGDYEVASREMGSEDDLEEILRESDSGILLTRWRVRAAIGSSNSDKGSDTTPLLIQPNLNSADSQLFLTIDEADQTKLALKNVKTEDVNLDTSHQWMLTPYILSLVSS